MDENEHETLTQQGGSDGRPTDDETQGTDATNPSVAVPAEMPAEAPATASTAVAKTAAAAPSSVASVPNPPVPTPPVPSVPVFTPIPDHREAETAKTSASSSAAPSALSAPAAPVTFTAFQPKNTNQSIFGDMPGFDGANAKSSAKPSQDAQSSAQPSTRSKAQSQSSLLFPSTTPSAGQSSFSSVNPTNPSRTSLNNDDLAVENMDKGLAQLDPLAIRPRMSSRILCIVLGLLLLAAAAGVWWLGVRTVNGQNFDDMVWSLLRTQLPSWLGAMVRVLSVNNMVVILSLVIAVAAIAITAIRKRWWLLGQFGVFAVVCYASELLKNVLPRPYLQHVDSPVVNSAPSGHTILAAAAATLLVCAVPRVWRAACAAIGSAYSMLVAISLVAAQWHRPTDVVMSLLLVGGWALLMLAFTRTSGMDPMGSRVASASIQIVGSVMITGGIMIIAYGGYLLWQIEPGLSLRAQWTQAGSCVATMLMICGVSMLVFGMVLAMRQLTASPLTKLGLVGAPPAPPSKPTKRSNSAKGE